MKPLQSFLVWEYKQMQLSLGHTILNCVDPLTDRLIFLNECLYVFNPRLGVCDVEGQLYTI